jgi:hypothetical protein
MSPTLLKLNAKAVQQLDHRFLETAPIGGFPPGENDDSGTVMTGLVPVIHVVQLPESLGVAGNGAAWMAGKNPAMTDRAV